MTYSFRHYTVDQRVLAGCSQLMVAASYARDASLDPWQLAVELHALHSAGLTNLDVRVLIVKGLVEHRQETTRAADHKRRFRPIRSLVFGERTCLILTEEGRASVEAFLAGNILLPQATNDSITASPRASVGEGVTRRAAPSAEPDHPQRQLQPPVSGVAPGVGDQRELDGMTPHWNAIRHEFRYGSVVVKHFRRPAPSLQRILSAFEEEGWPSVIHDPLPCSYGDNPKRRLHHTVRNLNTMQSPHLVHFYVNGHGEEIHWNPASQLASKPRAKSAPRARKQR